MMQVSVETVAGGHWLDVIEALVNDAEAQVQRDLGQTPKLSLVSLARDGLAVTREASEPTMYEYSATFEVVGRRA